MLGAAGVNLMPTLDRKVQPTDVGISDYALCPPKNLAHYFDRVDIWSHVISVSLVEPIRFWWDLWLKWSLGIGMVVACCWNGAKLISKEKEIKPLPRTRPGQFRVLQFFNLPLLTAITLLATGGVMLLGQFHWLQLWWITPLIGLGITLALAALQTVPRLLRHWMEILFFPRHRGLDLRLAGLAQFTQRAILDCVGYSVWSVCVGHLPHRRQRN